MREAVRSLDPRLVVTFLLGLVPFGLLALYVEVESAISVGAFFVLFLLYFCWSYVVVETDSTYGWLLSPGQFVVVLLAAVAASVLAGWVRLSIVALTHLSALVLVAVYYGVIVALAIYDDAVTGASAVEGQPYPSVSVLVPAYNEEGYVGATIAAVLDADYPDGKKEVVVVDDGSTDGTYAEALEYSSSSVKVARKDNGGKYSALNYGLLFASGEIVVTIDADSIIERRALKDVVVPFQHDENVGAVASDVRIINDGGLVSKCQRLEYAIGINVFRRALDLVGTVTVVPGCLGAFRRDLLDDVYGYDPETLTEDFDVTMKVLKSGMKVAASDAVVYTEAPDTWRDLYNQRLRWSRGNYMTVFKHWDVLRDAEFGYLHRLAFPYALVGMLFLPFASWVIVFVIGMLLLTGTVLKVLIAFVLFTAIVTAVTALAIEMEDESWDLLLYSPLFVIGYKQFLDVISIKSLLDVTFDRELHWTRARRVHQHDRPVDSSERVATRSESD